MADDKELRHILSELESDLQAVTASLASSPIDVQALQLRVELLETIALTRSELHSRPSASPISPSYRPMPSEHETSTSAPGVRKTASPAAQGTVQCGPELRPSGFRVPLEVPEVGLAGALGLGIEVETSEERSAKRPRLAGGADGNARMHPRSRYAGEEPDFASLAGRHPGLEAVTTRRSNGSVWLDFTRAEVSRELTRALMAEDFGVDWWVADGQLIPPVPNRLNYILWIEDLLQLSSPPGAEGRATVRGLDIGCGANMIYPLLGAALHGWSFVGVDITDIAEEGACRNRDANPQLAPLLEVRRVTPLLSRAQAQVSASLPTTRDALSDCPPLIAAATAALADTGGNSTAEAAADTMTCQQSGNVATWLGGAAHTHAELASSPAVQDTAKCSNLNAMEPILLPAIRPGEHFAFSMCNPPFFESRAEAGLNPHTAHAGTDAEMVCPGGEVAFVSQMVLDSAVLRGSVHWYTSMVGKKSTLKAVKLLLRQHGATAVRTTELAQGKTSRWAIAWSFTVSPALASQPIRRLLTSKETPLRQHNDSEPARRNLGRSTHLLASRDTPALCQPEKLGPVRRRVSFDVKAQTAAGLKLLHCVVDFLKVRGAQCTVKESSLTVTAIVMLEGAVPLSIHFALQQQEAAVYVVTASVAASCGNLQCREFMQIVKDIKGDVLQVWQCK